MAEEWHLAFGRYLRTLRKRCSLSLRDVVSLSQSFPDTLNKGYLSRCENGHQRIAFSKIIPLSRIYKVPADVLLERIELDLELEKVGGPDTEGMSFAELTAAGAAAAKGGRKWDAWGYLRDAVVPSVELPLRPRFRDTAEQFACAEMTCGTAARGLGKFLLARHEFLHVLESKFLGPDLSAVLFERLSCVSRDLRDSDGSRSYADRAIEEAERIGHKEFLGHMYTNRGLQAHTDKDMSLAVSLYEKAYRVLRDTDRLRERAVILVNLAQVHFDLGRLGVARRTLGASLSLTRDMDDSLARALAHALLGEIAEREGREEQAARHWKTASRISKAVRDPVTRFKVDYRLMKQAHRNGNEAVTRAIGRRLRKLANYIPENTEELDEYKEFVAAISLAS